MVGNIAELIQKVKAYNTGADIAFLQKAYDFAEAHHRGQTRASGEPYISHPLTVASMLADLKLDLSSIMAGLLHDTVEDTPATIEDIQRHFGDEVMFLVGAVTKLSKLDFQTKNQAQAENLRKLVLAMAQDIRVLIIKLIDRLHNMETIEFLTSEERRQGVAAETLEIYAPLAQRIGMYTVQEKLQNLAFAVIDKDAYHSILSKVSEFHEKGKDIIENVLESLQDILKKGNLEASVYGREKKPYSIWRKMQRKNINFDELSDLFGFRVIVNSKADCYQALCLIHDAKLVIPKTFKDYISTPKENHYEALHTKVLGPHGTRVEIQIRTKHMQEVAERGVAAHWQYKQGIPAREMKTYQWLQGLLEILEKTLGAEEFLEQTKLAMFEDQVFCFTPKGDMISLPMGATVLDFAYMVHSEIGNKCIGGHVNGHKVSLKAELQMGDTVEIITRKEARPLPDWEQYAVSGKAQANIRRFLRAERRAHLRSLGTPLFEKNLDAREKDLYARSGSRVLKYFSLQRFDDLLVQLGEGALLIDELKTVICDPQLITRPPIEIDPTPSSKSKEKIRLPIRGTFPDMPISYATCCQPVPGDKIAGILVKGKDLLVHRQQCDLLEGKDVFTIRWNKPEDPQFQTRFLMTLHQAADSLGEVLSIIAKEKADLRNIRILNQHKGSFDMALDLHVKDLEHIKTLLGLLRFLDKVQSVERA
jgi:guanosine-3',5'-bis(diphosphate) 3'-pyrophosphohydrolase